MEKIRQDLIRQTLLYTEYDRSDVIGDILDARGQINDFDGNRYGVSVIGIVRVSGNIRGTL